MTNSNSSSPRLLCSERGPSTTTGGVPITDFLSGGQYGQLDTQNTSTHAYGGSLQLTDTGKLFGRDNHLVVGASLDIGRTRFNAASFLGGLTSGDRDFVGPGVVIDEPGSNCAGQRRRRQRRLGHLPGRIPGGSRRSWR